MLVSGDHDHQKCGRDCGRHNTWTGILIQQTSLFPFKALAIDESKVTMFALHAVYDIGEKTGTLYLRITVSGGVGYCVAATAPGTGLN